MSAREKTLAKPPLAAVATKLPLEVTSRFLRAKLFLRIEEAGGQIGLTRTGSYQAVRQGLIPVERFGPRFTLVRKTTWDAEVRRLRQKLHPPRRRRTRPQAEAAPEATA